MRKSSRNFLISLVTLSTASWVAVAAPSMSPVRGPGHPLADVPGSGPCAELVARLPNVKAPLCEAAKLKPTVGRSVQGRTLYYRDVVAPEAQVRVLVIGSIHGDELSSAALALHWIQNAVERMRSMARAIRSPSS